MRKCPYCHAPREEADYVTAGKVHKICNKCRAKWREKNRLRRSRLSPEELEAEREYTRLYWRENWRELKKRYKENAVLRKENQEEDN